MGAKSGGRENNDKEREGSFEKAAQEGIGSDHKINPQPHGLNFQVGKESELPHARVVLRQFTFASADLRRPNEKDIGVRLDRSGLLTAINDNDRMSRKGAPAVN